MNTIILLTGIAGTGKKTIGETITQIDPNFKLAHHHDYLDPILKLLDDHPFDDNATSVWNSLNEKGWDALTKARGVIFDTIANACPSESSFVITYELLNNNVYHQAIFNEIADLAKKRNASFIPVRLICDLDELIKRLTHEKRKNYYKTQDVALIKARFAQDEVFKSQLATELTLDVSKLTPNESASKILSWVDTCYSH